MDDMTALDPSGSEESTGGAEEDDERSRMLDSLRGDDWLVRSTMGDTFWQGPTTKQKDSDPYTLDMMMAGDDSDDSAQGDERQEFSPLLEGFFGQPVQPTTLLGFQDSQPNRINRSEDSSFFGQGVRPTDNSNKRDAFRELLGMQPSPTLDQSFASPDFSDRAFGGRITPSSTPSYSAPPLATPSFSTAPSGFDSPSTSFQPVNSGWNSLFQTSPGASRTPSGIESLQPVAPSSPSSTPDSRLSNPLYQPPRRGF